MPQVREHVADGIQEYDNPLPGWWLWLFNLSLVFAVIYGILYPSLWCWKGTLGWSSPGQYEVQMAQFVSAHPTPPAVANNPAEDLDTLSKNPPMVAAGHEIFDDNCVVCHGMHGEGKIGPNLHGPHFRYGGDSKTILTTIREGRKGGMPTWKKFLKPGDIVKVASFVYSLRYDRTYPNDGNGPDVPK
ncbi:MAG TPA: cbb3-type cytochrome c oxidase N-terminal domain-containing protein [Candidatus Xenobia bacterium]